MPVTVQTPFYKPQRPLGSQLNRLSLLRQSQVDFIPDGAGKRTLRTRPLIEDNVVTWRERYIEAALAYINNPLIFAAQSLINDTLADARIVVEKKKGDLWKENENNTLIDFLRKPNSSMDAKEYVRAYSTHLHTFGSIFSIMFQQGSILPNGKINDRENCFDVIFPALMHEDLEANPNRVEWWYLPRGFREPLRVRPEGLFMDVIYNPIAHSVGLSLPNNPLNIILDIHTIYLRKILRHFRNNAAPDFILTRRLNINNEPLTGQVDDVDIEEAVQRIYARVGQAGDRPNGWLGLSGDWRVQKIGSTLNEMVNKDLIQLLEAIVVSVYKIPASLFWIGLESSNQRASRQMDAMDFYNTKIHPLLERIAERLSDFLVPLFFGKDAQKKWRIYFNTDEMPIAKYVRDGNWRIYERWWLHGALQRGRLLNYLNEPTTDWTPEQLKEVYSGGNQGTGRDDLKDPADRTESENGLE